MIYRIEKDKNIELAAQIIINGDIIIYSTDTLYGFGVDATNSKAIEKLNKIKGRSQPYSIVVSSLNMLKKYAKINNDIEIRLKKIFPGPFTAILKKIDNNLSELVTTNLPTVGVRIPNFNPILKVIKKIKKPIITTSVNYHGESSINKLQLIESFYPDIDIFTDYKDKESIGSTIIDFSSNPFKILRQGDGVY